MKKTDIYLHNYFDRYSNEINWSFIFNRKFYLEKNFDFIADAISDIFCNFITTPANKKRHYSNEFIKENIFTSINLSDPNQITIFIVNKDMQDDFSDIQKDIKELILETIKEQKSN